MANITTPLNYIIRPYLVSDRSMVRQIAFDTAFMGASADIFFEGREFLQDALTRYFTDYEPDSAWVAETKEGIVGYIIGAKNETRMNQIFLAKIVPDLLIIALQQALFFRLKNLKLLKGIVSSLLHGEFYAPSFTKKYPAVLHINLKSDYRGQGIGYALMQVLINDYMQAGIHGVHLATMSSAGAEFFQKNGFNIIFKSKRSYLNNYTSQDIPLYILGRVL
ncbi:MAG: GNAT family N-acetyltransferase [Candidatus Omnitrophota bacterium]